MKRAIRKRRARTVMLTALAISLASVLFAETASDESWKVVNRSLTAFEDAGRKAVHLDERAGQGLAWRNGATFAEGTIEFDVRGRDVEQRSFVGVAFHAADEQTFEAVYFRPFNFRSSDPAKAGRAVQYVSHPEFTWQKLRTEKPGLYEKAISPAPDPDGWFHVRIVCASTRVGVYVDGSPEPCLEVEKLGDRGQGMVGLFVGNGSGGDFSGLAITPSAEVAEGTREKETFDAVKAGDLAKVQSLVEKDPLIVNAKVQGDTPILFAALWLGRSDIVKYLVSKGADVNTVMKYAGTPMDVALDSGDAEVIDLLRSKGARPTPLEFETFRLAENVHRIAFPWGMRNNVIAYSGPDGILLVDTGFSRHAVDALKKTIAGLAKGVIKFVVNTHPHGDHVEGNGIASPGGRMIGFPDLDGPDLKGLLSKSEEPLRGPAGRELRAGYVMPFNGEDVRIIPNPDLHSPADVLVYFLTSKVLCMGDLLLSQNCPAVQDVSGYMSFLDTVLDVFPPGTTFVSGHGKDLTKDGLRKYRDDLAGMTGIVQQYHAAGQSAEDMVRNDVLGSYKAEYSFLDWLGPDSWIPRICRGLQSGTAGRPPKSEQRP